MIGNCHSLFAMDGGILTQPDKSCTCLVQGTKDGLNSVYMIQKKVHLGLCSELYSFKRQQGLKMVNQCSQRSQKDIGGIDDTRNTQKCNHFNKQRWTLQSIILFRHRLIPQSLMAKASWGQVSHCHGSKRGSCKTIWCHSITIGKP